MEIVIRTVKQKLFFSNETVIEFVVKPERKRKLSVIATCIVRIDWYKTFAILLWVPDVAVQSLLSQIFIFFIGRECCTLLRGKI